MSFAADNAAGSGISFAAGSGMSFAADNAAGNGLPPFAADNAAGNGLPPFAGGFEDDLDLEKIFGDHMEGVDPDECSAFGNYTGSA